MAGTSTQGGRLLQPSNLNTPRSNLWRRAAVLGAVAILMAGVVCRFTGLSEKPIWWDEAATLLWLSGHWIGEAVPSVFNGQTVRADEIENLRKTGPSVLKTIKAVALSDAKHPPIYYTLLYFWSLIGGNGIGVLRALSALLSCLALPLAWWFGMLATGKRAGGWVLAAMMAASPFQVLYAQEARPYALWTVAVLASSLALLIALRQGGRVRWLLYATSVAAGLYSYLLFALVALAQAAGVLLIRLRNREPVVPRDSLRSFGFWQALALGCLVFVPWIGVFVHNFSIVRSNTEWLAQSIPVRAHFSNLLHGFGSVFIDAPGADWLPKVAFVCLCLALVAMYHVARKTPPDLAAPLLSMAILPVAFLVAWDLWSGGTRSAIPRFQLSAYVAVEMVVAIFLTHLLMAKRHSQRIAGGILLSALLTGGVLSSVAISRARFVWTKWEGAALTEAANTIGRADQPLVVVDPRGFCRLITLAPLLPSETPLLLVPPMVEPVLVEGYESVFILKPSDELIERYATETKYTLEPFERGLSIWRLAPKPKS